MNQPLPNTSRFVLATAVVAVLALSSCKRDADDTAAPAPEITAPSPTPTQPLATAPSLTVSSVTLGTTAGADGRIATPMMTFTTSDPIVVSIDTSGAATNAEITARLIFEDGQTAGEQSETITSTGTDTTNVTFTNANGWPAGSYRAEVWVNGTQAQSRDFTVR